MQFSCRGKLSPRKTQGLGVVVPGRIACSGKIEGLLQQFGPKLTLETLTILLSAIYPYVHNCEHVASIFSVSVSRLSCVAWYRKSRSRGICTTPVNCLSLCTLILQHVSSLFGCRWLLPAHLPLLYRGNNAAFPPLSFHTNVLLESTQAH